MIDRPHLWMCPKCTQRAASRTPHPAPMHQCRGLRGLTVPLLPEGVKADRRMVEREDWIGKEDVQYDGEGRPTMAVVTERDEGQDCVVYAPCARVGVES